MFGVKVKTENRTKRVKTAADKAAFRSFSHAAASIRNDAVGSIEVSPDPSPPGDPPHTRRRLLPRAVRFAVDKLGAVIGPTASVAGEVGHTHEFGGQYKGEQYPERPYMYPALERAVPRFAGQWKGAIGE